jgi:ABC-2 type transport system ATP-binding protein
VTGFLGPNGAGKTTTLRCLLGLVEPTSGSATIGGQRYHDLDAPMRVVGSALEATGFHPGRSARNHLRVLARSGGLDEARVPVVLDTVGLTEASGRAVGGFSLGMRQRLQLAAALLGDPGVLVLDEPATASTRRASPGCARSCATSPARAARSSSRATCCRRSSRPWTTS